MNENVILFLALDEKALKVLGECLGPHMIECQILCKLFKLGIVMSHDWVIKERWKILIGV